MRDAKICLVITKKSILTKSNILFAVLIIMMLCAMPFDSVAAVEINFKDSAWVTDTVIRLKDIASIYILNDTKIDSTALMDCVIAESAPPGYSLFIAPSDVICLYVSKRFVETKFTFNKNKRISVHTRAKQLRVGDFRSHIVGYIRQNVAWDSSAYSVVINNENKQVKCYDRPYEVFVKGLKSPYPKGPTNIKLILQQQSKSTSVEIACNIMVKVPVLISATTISKGSRLNSENIRLVEKDITAFAFEPIISLKQLEGKRAKRTISSNSILHEGMFEMVPLVERGDPVEIVSRKGNIRIAVQGIAKESGSAGEKIWVENTMSKKLIRTEIIQRGKVQVF